MAKLIRYALAAICFAASVSCFAFWGWTVADDNAEVTVRYFASSKNADGQSPMFTLDMIQGEVVFRRYDETFVDRGWDVRLTRVTPTTAASFRDRLSKLGLFFVAEPWVYLPLWYPALLFALAGIGVLRFRRQFSMRSALIGLAVVAALLGMVAAL